MEPNFFPDEESEKKRYLEHNNDIYDLGYQNFVSPVVSKVKSLHGPNDSGLDFGSGPGPVISHLLAESGYSIQKYDPYFFPNPSIWNQVFDYIVACEVVEHFYDPHKEFARLRTLLHPDRGNFIVYTDPIYESLNFPAWYYKNDPTHVFFYSNETMDWIRNEFGFSKLTIQGRLFVFSA